LKGGRLGGAPVEPSTALAVKVAPTASTSPTAIETAMTTKRDTMLLLGLDPALA
jgi:hypothetical protein